MKKILNLKAISVLILITSIFVLNTAMVLAHDEKTKDDGGERTNDGSNQQQTTTVTATADDFNFSVDTANSVATLLYADGTPLANAAVTVKNGMSGQDGDIEMNQSADANGVFDYSKWVSQGAKVLRVTDPKTNSAVEYDVETGTMTIEAGKNKGGDGTTDGHSHSHGASSTTMYVAIAGAVVVIGVGAGIVVAKKKKAKAEFEASKANKKKKKSSGKDKK